MLLILVGFRCCVGKHWYGSKRNASETIDKEQNITVTPHYGQGVSNSLQIDCFLISLFMLTSKKTSELHVTGSSWWYLLKIISPNCGNVDTLLTIESSVLSDVPMVTQPDLNQLSLLEKGFQSNIPLYTCRRMLKSRFRYLSWSCHYQLQTLLYLDVSRITWYFPSTLHIGFHVDYQWSKDPSYKHFVLIIQIW